MRLVLLLAAFSLSSTSLQGQALTSRKVDVVQYLQASYNGIARDLIAAAAAMPDADYGFKPTSMAEARTYGAVIAHAADGMFETCARSSGRPNPTPNLEGRLIIKADVVKALADSVAFCGTVFASLTAQSGGEYLRQGPVEAPRLAILIGLVAHNAEMYGISTVYLRAKGIVPPASGKR